MLFLQCILFLFIVILTNNSNAFTSPIHPIHENVDNEILKSGDDLKRDEEQITIDREKKFKEVEKRIAENIQNTDVLSLNVGGELITTTRETLTRVPKSILWIMFNDRWNIKLPRDKNGNIFLDFNPIIFRHLLDQLQILDTNKIISFSPPSNPSLVLSFKKMMRKLGLDESLSSEKSIISFNVGGQTITNQRKTFNQIPNSTFDTIDSSFKITKFNNISDIFLDYDPKLFRYLIQQLRVKPFRNLCSLEASSIKEKIVFKKMLNDLNICRQLGSATRINTKNKWKRNGVTIAGGNGQGDKFNQLSHPYGVYIDDDDQCIYIADHDNHRIVRWELETNNGRVVAGGNGKGNQMNQLYSPTDIIIDKRNDLIIICDYGNRRVVKWSRQNNITGQIIMSNIACWGLTMNNDGDLYISDWKKDEVRQWKIGDINGTIIAGGNGEGNYLNQLKSPGYIFVDKDHSIYVSDWGNHRIMKWINGAKEGIVIAGGQGQGNNLTQLSHPLGAIVDQMGHIYVADNYNHRIILWSPESNEGSIIVGGNGKGQQSNQFNYLRDLSFDRNNNLYVVDWGNHRIQRFDIDST